MNRKTILILEDDRAISELISYVLLLENYDIINAEKLEPITTLTAYQPDLIILDEWVNDKEGHMLCKEIKKIHALARVPVIILSTSPDIDQIADTCDADGALPKPFDIADLIAEVKRCLIRSPRSSVGPLNNPSESVRIEKF